MGHFEIWGYFQVRAISRFGAILKFEPQNGPKRKGKIFGPFWSLNEYLVTWLYVCHSSFGLFWGIPRNSMGISIPRFTWLSQYRIRWFILRWKDPTLIVIYLRVALFKISCCLNFLKFRSILNWKLPFLKFSQIFVIFKKILILECAKSDLIWVLIRNILRTQGQKRLKQGWTIITLTKY